MQEFAKNGDFVGKWGSFGAADGDFKSPYAVAVSAGGYIYVADTVNARIQKFTPLP